MLIWNSNVGAVIFKLKLGDLVRSVLNSLLRFFLNIKYCSFYFIKVTDERRFCSRWFNFF